MRLSVIASEFPLHQQQTRFLLLSEQVGVSWFRQALVQRGTWLPCTEQLKILKIFNYLVRLHHFHKILFISCLVFLPQRKQVVGQAGMC